MLEFKVLGPLRVLVDNVDVPVDDPVDRALLAGLLLNPNHAVSPAEAATQHLPGTTPVHSLVESADRLRRLLEELPGPARLVRAENRYLLRIDNALIDRTRAENLLGEARRQPLRHRSEILRRANRLWPARRLDARFVQSPDLFDLRKRVLVAWGKAEQATGFSVEAHGEWIVAVKNSFPEPFETDWENLDPGAAQTLYDSLVFIPWANGQISGAEPPDREALARRLLAVFQPPPGESGEVLTGTDTMPVSMYLSDEGAHTAVESAVESVLAKAGLSVVNRDDPVFGSWFRRVRASEIGTMAAHAADSRLVLAHDAQVTSTMMRHIGEVLTALQTTKEAVVRIGAVLIVKFDDQLAVHQLTAAQQLQLDHDPQLAMAPHQILTALRIGDHPGWNGHRPEGISGVSP
jgi:hypothetical protein